MRNPNHSTICLDENEGEEMKPSILIKQKCKTLHQQLKVCYTLIDYFLGTQEARWVIECQIRKKKPRMARIKS
jgi:hypothetical protein